MKTWTVPLSLTASILLALAAPTAQASSAYSGTTAATWTSPILSGLAVDGASGAESPANSTATAVCNLAGCPTQLTGYSSSTIAWGNYLEGGVTIPTSTVTFTPASFSNVAAGQVFALGTLNYTNGTSDNVIYGATLTISLQLTSGTATQPSIIPLSILTTANDGTPQQNADYLDFGTSTFESTQPVTFNVLEEDSAKAILYGEIVGDPQLVVTSIALDPASAGAGFIGSGVPAVPEPQTYALIAVGLAAISLARKRKH